MFIEVCVPNNSVSSSKNYANDIQIGKDYILNVFKNEVVIRSFDRKWYVGFEKNISEFSKLIDIYGEFEFCNNQIKISSKAVDARGQMVLGFTLEVIEHSIIIPECKATEKLEGWTEVEVKILSGLPVWNLYNAKCKVNLKKN